MNTCSECVPNVFLTCVYASLFAAQNLEYMYENEHIYVFLYIYIYMNICMCVSLIEA